MNTANVLHGKKKGHFVREVAHVLYHDEHLRQKIRCDFAGQRPIGNNIRGTMATNGTLLATEGQRLCDAAFNTLLFFVFVLKVRNHRFRGQQQPSDTAGIA